MVHRTRPACAAKCLVHRLRVKFETAIRRGPYVGVCGTRKSHAETVIPFPALRSVFRIARFTLPSGCRIDRQDIGMGELQLVVVHAGFPGNDRQRAGMQSPLHPIDVGLAVGEEHQYRRCPVHMMAPCEIGIIDVDDQTESAPRHRERARLAHMCGERHLLPDFRLAQRSRGNRVGDAERIIGQRIADGEHTQRFQRADAPAIRFEGRNRCFQCGAHSISLWHKPVIAGMAEIPAIAHMMHEGHFPRQIDGHSQLCHARPAALTRLRACVIRLRPYFAPPRATARHRRQINQRPWRGLPPFPELCRSRNPHRYSEPHTHTAKPRNPQWITGVSSRYFAIHASTRWTLPALMHFTQTRTRTFSPLMVVRTGCRFGRKVRLLRICECETV